MIRFKILGVSALLAICLLSGCSKGGGSGKLHTEADSVAYVIGLNIGRNLLKMDSTLNVAAVYAGIGDVFRGEEGLPMAEARMVYLRYVNYSKPEKVRALEEQFLEDIARDNRSYARTNSGLTYTVETVGNEQQTPRADLDTVVIRFVGRTIDGREFDSSYERKDTLRVAVADLRAGFQESVKLIGEGGKINVWIPSALNYGGAGSKEFGIKANETLYYQIELIDLISPNATARRTSNRETIQDF
ncbi:MAG: FKBP-type peptidyl-prolyl cis-trans isomerase [Alistipes sp.]